MPADFARMIKLGNGKPELVKWVKKHFKCDDCEANKRPRSRRPAAVPKSYRFNHVVGIDLLELRNHDGVKQFWLNMICWGTSYALQVIVPGDNAKTAKNVWKAKLSHEKSGTHQPALRQRLRSSTNSSSISSPRKSRFAQHVL